MILYKLVVSVLVIFADVDSKSRNFRIILGNKSLPGQFPFMSSILFENKHHCGGSIIGKQWILTAAHCFYGSSGTTLSPLSYKVAVGSVILKGGTKHDVKCIYIHQLYNLNVYAHDIALIQVTKNFEFDGLYVKTIPLNWLPLNEDYLNATVIGWGYRSEYEDKEKLPPKEQYFAKVWTISEEECSERLEVLINHDMLCVFTGDGRGTCGGDSGGPLIYEGKLIGILSYGGSCKNTSPEVYTRISSYYPWIHMVIYNNSV